MKNLNKRAKILLAIAGVVIVVVVAGGYVLTVNGLDELPLFGSTAGVYLEPQALCVNPGSTRTLTQMHTTWGVNRWASADTAVATVIATGTKTANVTGVAVGDAIVRAQGTFFSDAAMIHVSFVCPHLQDIRPGHSIQPVTNLSGGEWVSTNPAVADVGSDGRLYGKSLGTTTIIYSIAHPSNTLDRIISVRVTNDPGYDMSW